MKLILAFLIFGGMIAAGIATMCVICKEISEEKLLDNCVGEQRECADDETCASQIEYSILNDTITTVNKRCLPSNQTTCNQMITLNTTEYQYLVYTECCYTDGCNSGPIQMPPVDQNKNGRVCPICFIQGKDKCTEFGTRCCLGNQLQCLNLTGYIARAGQSFSLYTAQGCTTVGSCELNFATLPGSQVGEISTFTCTDAKPLE